MNEDIQAMAESVAASAWAATETTESTETETTAEPCGACPGCRARKFAEQMLAMYDALPGRWRIGNTTALGIGGERCSFIVVLVNDEPAPAQVVTQIMIESEETK